MDGRKLTPREAAEYLGVSVSLVYQLAEERRIVHYRLGGAGKRGRLFFLTSDLDDFLGSCKVPVTPPAPPPQKKYRHLT